MTARDRVLASMEFTTYQEEKQKSNYIKFLVGRSTIHVLQNLQKDLTAQKGNFFPVVTSADGTNLSDAVHVPTDIKCSQAQTTEKIRKNNALLT